MIHRASKLPPTAAPSVVVISGAAGGIGSGIARRLSASGSELVLGDADEAALLRLRQGLGEMAAPSRTALFVKADVTLPAGAGALVDAARDQFGGLDALVNVVGGGMPGKKGADVSDDEWQSQITLNLTSAFNMCRAVMPELVKRGGGSIVNIGSAAGMTGMRANAAYCAAKAGVAGLTRALALDYGDAGIRVNCVAPGPVRTPLMERLRSESEIEDIASRTILGRLATPDEIAAVVTFLIGDGGRYITAQTISVDGGQIALV